MHTDTARLGPAWVDRPVAATGTLAPVLATAAALSVAVVAALARTGLVDVTGGDEIENATSTICHIRGDANVVPLSGATRYSHRQVPVH